MTELSSWQKEFSFLRSWKQARQGILSFLLITFHTLHSISHWFLRVLIAGMMLLLVLTALKHMAGQGDSLQLFQDTLLQNTRESSWKAFRNALYVVMLSEFVFIAIPLLLFALLKGEAAKGVHAIATWLKTGFFLTFSFALSGLIIDLLFLFLFMSVNALGGSSKEVLPQFLTIFKLL